MYWPTMSESPVPRPSSVGSTQSGSNVSTKATSSRGKNDFCVGEELKIAVNIALERFRLSEDQKELEFPSSLTSSERAYIHKLSQSYGLRSKSKGKGASRYLTVAKKDGVQSLQSAATFHLVRNSRQQIYSLLQRCPLTAKERQELQQRLERNQYNEGLMKEMGKTTTGRLNNGVPQVPPPKQASDLTSFQQTLPIYMMRESITKAINDNRVLLVAGETGSGKTTQVPQMILDDCHAHGRPCRIFCTQPRRLSALSVAERVAAERGEKIGQTVGYQIRLESRVSPKTLLTFCTNGVLLRTLMAGEQSLATVTHVIVDEIHERDRFSDFLLIVLRDILPKMKNLKLVLMSAALNIQMFSTYFNGCAIMSVPGQLFDVQEQFLEDVLKWTGYTNKEMEKCKLELSKAVNLQKNLDSWFSKQLSGVTLIDDVAGGSVSSASVRHHSDRSQLSQECQMLTEGGASTEVVPEKDELEPHLVQEMDQLLTAAWLMGRDDIFSQIFLLILNENVSVDYIHSETSVTPLMVAAGRGFLGVVEQLLNMGANIAIRSSNDWQALDWAQKYEQHDVVELLEAHIAALEQGGQDEMVLVKQSSVLSPEDKELLNIYHHSFDDEKVDIDLVVCLLYKIHSRPQNGAILVFLPGYDEIVTLRDRIQEDKRFSDSNRYILYLLHSQMQSSDQKRAFKNPGPGVRKIILSTNIAETSVTINDVVFVVDSGKVKEKSYDALTSVSMLKSHWISKASALQRKGRAGRCRPGIVFRLFSRVRYDGMPEFQDPEILRYPLQELCLHTKLLAPNNCLIADFLAKAPEPPAFLITRNAVHLLKQIDALDPFEDLTELGHHLADLPVEPRYGKMILYSVVLKCLDPILTIACALAYRDPFLLPAHPYQKRAAAMSRRKFAAGTFSDHMALLRAFQGWQKARAEGWERSFCERNLLSFSTMEMIVGMRTQLLGQLRASGFVRARGGGDIRDLNSNSENWAVVKAALCAGMYPNIIRVDRERFQLATAKENKVRFHNTSILGPAPNEVGPNNHNMAISRLPTDWIAFEEMTRMHRTIQVRSCTVVSSVTVALFAGPAKMPSDSVRDAESAYHHGSSSGMGDSSINNSSDSDGDDKDDSSRSLLRLDDWISFRLDPDASALIIQLRQKWHSLFLRRMRSPTKLWSQFDENTIRTVVSVLTNEEQALGLQQPAGIGQRPRPMSTETVVSCGGSRRGSCDDPTVSGTDEAGQGWSGQDFEGRVAGGLLHQQQQIPVKEFGGKNEDKSETSSAPSSNSAPGSDNNSRKGSAASSPRESPQPSSSVQRPPSEGDASTPGTHSPCRYFIMKAANNKMLVTSEEKGLWATAPSNEKKISKAFKEDKTIYLIFSVHGSNYFQGIARITGPVSTERVKEFHSPGLGGTIPVQWIKRSNISFQQCQHLVNAWNDNKKVTAAKDGQEIEPSVGEQLLRLWDKPPMTQHPQSARYSGHPPQLGANSSHGQVDYANPNRNQSGHHGNQYSAWSPNQKSYGQWTTPGVRGNQQSNQGYPGGSYPVMARMDEMNAASQMGSAGIPMGGHQGYGQGYGSQRGQGQFQKGYNMTPSPSMQGSSSSSSVMIMQRSTTDPNAKNTGSM